MLSCKPPLGLPSLWSGDTATALEPSLFIVSPAIAQQCLRDMASLCICWSILGTLQTRMSPLAENSQLEFGDRTTCNGKKGETLKTEKVMRHTTELYWTAQQTTLINEPVQAKARYGECTREDLDDARTLLFLHILTHPIISKKKKNINFNQDSIRQPTFNIPTASYSNIWNGHSDLAGKKKVCLHVDSNKETTSDGCGEKREPTSSQYDIFKTEQLMGEAGRKEEKSQ